jgi:hypothetical protein
MCVSFRRQISTPFLLRKWSRSSVLPRTTLVFQQASLKALPWFALGRKDIPKCEEVHVFKECAQASLPCWNRGSHGEKTACQFYTGLGKEILQEIWYPRNDDWLSGGHSVESVCLERGGWDSTNDTSGRASLLWPPASVACHSVRLTGSDDVGVVVGVAWVLKRRLHRTTCFQPHPAFSCSADGLGGPNSGEAGAYRCRLSESAPLSLALRQLPLLPSNFYNRDSWQCSYLLVLWGDTLPRWVDDPASHTPWRAAGITLRVPKTLAAFALQTPFSSVERLHIHCQPADISEWMHFRKIRASHHRHHEVWWQGAVLLGVLIPSLR